MELSSKMYIRNADSVDWDVNHQTLHSNQGFYAEWYKQHSLILNADNKKSMIKGSRKRCNRLNDPAHLNSGWRQNNEDEPF